MMSFIFWKYSELSHQNKVHVKQLCSFESTWFHLIVFSHDTYILFYYMILFSYSKQGSNWSRKWYHEIFEQKRFKINMKIWYQYHLFNLFLQFSIFSQKKKHFQQYLSYAYLIIKKVKLDLLQAKTRKYSQRDKKQDI